MAGRIPEHILEDILGRVDIVEIIAASIPLKRAGRNFKACCPFHHEKTPSFMVSADKQIYHCFGCGESGNAIKFLMRHERMEFLEAVDLLAKKAGVVLPAVRSPDISSGESVTALHAVMDAAVDFYAAILKSPQGAAARSYLARRGITAETAVLCKLGLAPDSWDALIGHLRGKSFSLAVIEKAGLAVAKESGGFYDRFRNRVIFPIFDIRNRPIAFGARVLDGSLPKYLNSPETPLYTKGRHVYGLNLARDSIRDCDCAVVVEGYLDFIVPYQAGYRSIVASLGTALTHEQVRLLKRYTQNIVVVYDADTAGELASVRSLDIFIEEDVRVKVASLPKGFDPDSYVRAHGVGSFRSLIETAQNLFDYKLRMLKSGFDVNDPHGKARIASGMLETIGKIKHEVLKAEYISRLAQELKTPEGALLIESRKVKSPQAHTKEPAIHPPQRVPVTATEKLLIKLMLEETRIIERVRSLLDPEHFQDERTAKIVAAMFERAEQGKGTDAAHLIHRFPEDDIAHIVCESVFGENEDVSADHKERVVEDCIRQLKSRRLKLEKEYLHERIKEAQRSGDDGSLRQLMEEFHSLIKTQSK